MTSETYVPRRYVELENPYGHKGHRHHHHRRSGGCGCLSWWCCCCFFGCCRWIFCTILIIIILLVGICVGLYFLLKPKIPSYDIENIDINSFEMRNDNKVYLDVVVIVKAENPNSDIGLNYLENEFGVMYEESQLCSGQLTPFVQAVKNTTTVNVELKGENQFSHELRSQFMQDQKKGKIPLLITVRLPIRLVFYDFIHLKKFVVSVNCSLVIDKVQPHTKPNILEKDYTYDIDL